MLNAIKKVIVSIIKGSIMAFSMYSIIPMVKIDWDKNSQKYALVFFPFVGAVIGGAIYLWLLVALKYNISEVLFAAIIVVIPIFISGGIHMDGFIDTIDGLSSRQPMEKKLEILKDPNVGAFGAMLCAVYLLVAFGIAGQFYKNPKYIYIIIMGYMISRVLSAYSITTFKTAKNSGLVYIFQDSANKKIVKILLTSMLIALFSLLLHYNFKIGLSIVGMSIIWFSWYKKICYKEFGGITGDLAGYFLQIYEILIMAIVVIFGIVESNIGGIL